MRHDARDLLQQLAQLDDGSGVVIPRDDHPTTDLLIVLAAAFYVDIHAALGQPPAWHVLVLPAGRTAAAAERIDQ